MENSPHAHPPAPLRVFRLSSVGAVKRSWGKSSLQTWERFPGQRRAAAAAFPVSQSAAVILLLLLMTSVVVSSQTDSSRGFAII